jgi:hypothetical protein
MQIYLPDDLYAEVKSRQLRVSELAQQAFQAEIRRQKRIDALNEYLAELIAETGEPSPEDLAWAEDFVAGIKAKLRPPAEEHDEHADPHRTPKAS